MQRPAPRPSQHQDPEFIKEACLQLNLFHFPIPDGYLEGVHLATRLADLREQAYLNAFMRRRRQAT